jgi:amino acid adenylation domain-containing protein/non-ribosomal peptide synthase protein (TIGR01720 family)
MSGIFNITNMQNLELIQKGKDYWNNLLAAMAAGAFPADKNGTGVAAGTVAAEVTLPNNITQAIIKLSNGSPARMHLCLLAGVAALLYRYNTGQEILVGIPVYKQESGEDLLNRILLIRKDLTSGMSYKQLLLAISQDMKEAIAHQNFPLNTLLFQKRMADRDTGVSMIDVFVLLEDLHDSTYIQPLKPGIVFVFRSDDAGNMYCRIEYNAARFTSTTIHDIGSRLMFILEAGLQDMMQDLTTLNLLSEQEKALINSPAAIFSSRDTQSIISLFEEQVAITPALPALQFGEQIMTYSELDARANQFAAYLRQVHQIAPGDRVAIKMPRSQFMIVAILGVLKSGAAYIPIDPEYPAQRIAYITADSHSRLLIDELVVQQFEENIDTYSQERICLQITADQLVYIIYTSGSTGLPKGVAVKNSNLVNYVDWANSYYFNTGEAYCFGLFTSLSFDLTVTSIFTTLLRGDRLYIFPESNIADIIREVFLGHTLVNTIKITPSHLNVAINLGLDTCTIQTIILGGEQLKKEHVTFIKQLNPDIKIYNEYGPTETTVGCTCALLTGDEELITIGRPVRNTNIYIADAHGNLVPPGIPGEIFIGGAGVAVGYYNNQALTDTRFFKDPYAADGSRIYNSGDLGRWLPDGNILYLGRKDGQVKINGFRIETDEVEHHLVSFTDVSGAVVLAKHAADGLDMLYAFFTSTKVIEPATLREYLQTSVPAYMIPHFFHQVEEIPLTPNGKADTKALLDMKFSHHITTAYVPPGTELERELCAIWQDVLGHDKVGVLDNFFTLGGHSLKATRLMTRYKKQFNVHLSLQDIFLNTDVVGHARLIDQARRLQAKEIPVAPSADSYPLSNAQKRIWLLCQRSDNSTVYNIPSAYQVIGKLDLPAFRSAVQYLITRHDIFRTSFRESSSGEPTQWISTPAGFVYDIGYHDLTSEESPDTTCRWHINEMMATVFDLRVAPLFRLSLLKTGIDKHVLLLNMHHIISDAWSMEIFTRELFTCYSSHVAGKAYRQAPLNIQYKDYAVWQHQQLNDILMKESRNYWLNQLSDDLPVLEVAANRFTTTLTREGEIVHMKLPPTIAALVKERTRQQKATIFMGLLAVVKVLLYRYTGQEDLAISIPVAGREHPDLENQIGFYVNTLVIRSLIDKKHTFSQFLDIIKETMLGAYAHQDYPFDLVAADNPGLKLNVMVDIQSNAFSRLQDDAWQGLKITSIPTGNNKVKFDLNFIFTEAADDLYLTIKYDKDKYTHEFIQSMGRHFMNLTQRLYTNMQTVVRHTNMLDKEEEDRLLKHYLGNTVPYGDQTILDLFSASVSQHATREALVYDEVRITYKELDGSSNRFGHYLQEQYGIKPGDKVGILLPRSHWLPVVILGILKCGAAYVPIDPDSPRKRVDYIVDDSGACLLIDEEELSRFSVSEHDFATTPVNADIIPSYLVYVIYTSGSSGQPKGVEVEHRQVVNICHGWKEAYGLGDFPVRLLQLANVSFDVFFGDICRSLLIGGRMIICPGEVRVDPQALYALMKREEINLLEGTPALLLPLMSYTRLHQLDISFIKVLIFGSDTLNSATFRELVMSKGADMRIINSYGCTEAAIDSLYYEGQAEQMQSLGGHTPIGRTFPNISAFILGPELQLQPPGVAGELCISGAGLARGYLHRTTLTAEKFIPHPFLPGARLYHTGDLAYLMDSGDIGFLGRMDNQVKVHGHRIEPAEIENALCSHDLLEDALVITTDTPGGTRQLVAYFVSRSDDFRLEPASLRTYLSERLPVYMLPAMFVRLDKFPITVNGKKDIKALPVPTSLINGGAAYVAPVNEKERLLLEVCEEVLQRKNISTADDFFAMGGDSIKSILIVSRLRQRGYQLQVRDVLNDPCIADMAKHMNRTQRAIPQQAVEGTVILSHLQHMFLESEQPDKHHYNQSLTLYSQQRIDEEALQKIISALVVHHDALRIVVTRSPAGEWVQYNNGPASGYRFTMHDISSENDWQDIFRQKADMIQSGFDLNGGPLFHAGLFRCPDGDHLLLVIHHLIVDSVSWRIILEDLSALYSQHIAGSKFTLPPKTDSFQYWMEFQEEYVRTGQLLTENVYWEAVETHPVPPFPIDFPGGSNYYKDRTVVTISLDNDTTSDLLTRCHAAYKTEINDILLTSLGSAIHEILGADEFHVNLEGHGREVMGRDIDLTRTVGWFTSQFPVLIDAGKDVNLIGSIVRTKEMLHRIPNKGIGYGMLRNFTGCQGLIAPVTFNYLGEFAPLVNSGIQGEGFQYSALPTGAVCSPDQQCEEILAFSGMIVNGKLQLSFHYNKAQFRQSTITALAAAYEYFLRELIDTLRSASPAITPVDLCYQELSMAALSELSQSGRVEDVYELTPLQEGMYYHWLSSPSSTAYFEQIIYKLEGTLDQAALIYAYRQISARHAVLRTSFTNKYSNLPLQVVWEDVTPVFTFRDVSTDPDFDLHHFAATDRNREFDLGHGSQMRLSVLKTGSNEYTFLWSHHHILMDGWCVDIIIKEFYQLYYGRLNAQMPVMTPVTSFKEYIRWLRSFNRRAALDYWKTYLDGYDNAAVIPFLQEEVPDTDNPVMEEVFFIDVNETLRIKDFCKRNKITESSFMQMVWGILLSKYNNNRDVVFGAVVSGRPAELPGIEDMVGLFVNTVPVRIQYEEDTTVLALLRQVQDNSVEGLPYHYVQLADIQAENRLGSHLIGHLFTFQNFPTHDLIAEGIVQAGADGLFTLKESLAFGQTSYDFDITIVMRDTIQVGIKYSSTLYAASAISLIRQHIRNCITDILQDPTKPITALDYLDTKEIEKIKREIIANTTDVATCTIPELFSRQVVTRGEQVCLIFENTQLTYLEIDKLANSFAHFLQQNYGLRQGDHVSMQLERSEWLVITMLAILKQGCVYVPIDPLYPLDRIAYILSDSKSRLNITEEVIAMFKLQQWQYTTTAPVVQIHEDDNLYIIYTSGSTGRPKGVTITHRNAVNIYQGWQKVYALDTFDVCLLQIASVSFDVFFGDVCRSLLTGGRMVISSTEDKLDQSRLYTLMKQHEVNILEGTPMHIIPFMNYIEEEKLNLDFFKILILGSDTLSTAAYEHLQDTLMPGIRIINTYGTTETTIDTTYFEDDIRKYSAVKGITPIGRPFPNNHVYILDKDYNSLPEGVPGEICIGGIGVATGYWNKEELTLQKFRDDPWFPGKKMYCTGDMGRKLKSGDLAFLGRLDDQVKIRGYRIEPGEIEDAIRHIPHVQEAVVLIYKRHHGDQDLVAFFSATEQLDSVKIKNQLRSSLPDVMIPAFWIQLDEWPLTANGKIDRQHIIIPADIDMEGRAEYLAPSGEIELKLATIWQELLFVEKVSVKDNFFHLGGHSITLMRLISMIRKAFNLTIPIRVLFDLSTIELQARYIRSQQENTEFEAEDYDVIKL